LYNPDSVGKEVMVDEVADVTVPVPEIDDTVESNEEALNKSDVVVAG
jgi:hypothetical protein